MSCTACGYSGSPRVLVSCCKTNSRYAVTAAFRYNIRLPVGQLQERMFPGVCGTVVCLTWVRFSSRQQRRLVPVEGSIALAVTAPWIALGVSAEQKFSTNVAISRGTG